MLCLKLFIFVFLVHIVSCEKLRKLPEEDLPVPDLIKYWGYPVETHEATTDDGYILTLHRIPRGRGEFKSDGKSRPVVFLQHGLLGSSSNWVTNLPNESFAYLLADAGYDVWLGNVRGNTYSQKHVSLDVTDAAFWDFSFDELAKYDLPGMIDYVLRNTSHDQLYYVGHSQGTMMIFAGLSMNVTLQKKIKRAYLLAPVTRLLNIYSPIKDLAPFETVFKATFALLHIHQFLPSVKLIHFFADKLCPIDEDMCATIAYLLAGYDKKDFNETRIPVYFSHTPAGTSVKNMYHFAQFVRSGKFQQYDYGYLGNIVRYGSLSPPLYNFSVIQTPLSLVYGTEDWLAVPVDVKWTAQQFPHGVGLTEIEGYNHLDFVWGMSANRKVYDKIIKELLSELDSNQDEF